MSESLETQVRSLLDRYHQKAILLHRPYPPSPDASARSYLGGLPTLPDTYEWPMGCVDGELVPLHFVAQICCDELPANNSDLPKQGTLFFFVSMSEEMCWGETNNPNDDCRVIYCEELPPNTTDRLPPENLPTICNEQEYGWGSNQAIWRSPLDGRVYPKWPVAFYEFDSYPESPEIRLDKSIGTDAFGYAYADARNKLIGESLMESTGLGLARPARAKKMFLLVDGTFPNDVNYGHFPQCGAIITEIAARVVHKARSIEVGYIKDIEFEERRIAREEGIRERKLKELRQKWGLLAKIFAKEETIPPVEPRPVKEPTNRREWKEIEESGAIWLELADKIGPNGVPDAGTRELFKQWILKLNSYSMQSGRDHNRPLVSIQEIMEPAMRRVIQRCAETPDICRLIPQEYFEGLANHHQLVTANSRFGRSDYEGLYNFQAHQMLGHFPSTQDTIDADSTEVSLLHLFSDYGMSFMFCDCGEAHIFISPEDLRARRFDKAYARTQGG